VKVKLELQSQREEVAAGYRLAEALKLELQSQREEVEELQRLAGQLDGLRKDQLAWGHRLGRLEDGVEAAQNLEQRIEGLERKVDGLHAPAGMATLTPDHPVAVSGTSIVLSSGQYGCFMLRQPDLISEHILGGLFWDQHLKQVIEQAGRADGSAIDAGAYLGFHTAYMSRFFRTVWAFEPQTEIYRMLCANLLLNNCCNVTAVNGALYDTQGFLRLGDNSRQETLLPLVGGTVDYDRVGNAAALTFQSTDERDPAAVPAQTVDQLSLNDLAFIKVDTQGSDLRVLRGARATIQRCRPVIAAKYERTLTPGHGNTLDEFYSFFEEMAYDVQVLDNHCEGKQIDLLAIPR
jgi:FkbM family methyltransferase